MKADRLQKHKTRTVFLGIYRGLAHLLFMLGWLREFEESMRTGTRQVLSVTAAFAIALHTVLWAAVAPMAATAAIDPFTIICHSEASGPAEEAPDHGALVPGHACDHCNLCNAAAPPATPDATVIAQLAPAEILLVLHPVNLAPRDGIATSPHLARGPPSFA